MNELRTTNWLLLWIALMVFNTFYPETAKGLLVSRIMGRGNLGRGQDHVQFVKSWRRDNAERKEEQKEQTKNLAFMSELDAIRKKYDRGNQWNEATSLPEAYECEVATLRRKHGIVD